MTAYIFKIITLLGGLALFLFGMDVMGKSLERQSGGKLQTVLAKMSSSMSFLKSEAWFADLMISFTNPIVGILFGAVLTAVIQSSSASIGILQGLCSTGVVTYGAAIPIILG